ncbi:MAG: phage major capsid protein [Candidatus Kryptonium sp.]
MAELISIEKEELVKAIDEIVAQKTEEVKNSLLSEMKNKLTAPQFFVKSETPEWMKRMADAVKAVYNRDEAKWRQLTTGEGWIPREFSEEVIKKLAYENVFRKFARVISTNFLAGSIPRMTGSATAFWVPEGSAGTQSTPTRDVVNFTVNKLMVVIPVTEELLSATHVDLVNLLVDIVAGAFAQKEREAMVNGTGSGQPRGIRAETWSNDIGWDASDIYGTLVKAYLAVDPQYRASSVWLVSNKALNILLSAKDTTGRPLLNYYLQEFPGTLFGRPVYEVPEIPENLGAGQDETEIYFGDFSNYIIIDYKGGAIEGSESAEAEFTKDLVLFKFKKRLDAKFAYFEPGVNVVRIRKVK